MWSDACTTRDVQDESDDGEDDEDCNQNSHVTVVPPRSCAEPSVTEVRRCRYAPKGRGGDMTDSEARTERTGGLAAWAPRAVPGPGIELTPAQELAIAVRHLDDVGWCENMTGHITVQQGDRFLVNPWGLWWSEVTTSDLLTIDGDGAVIDG